MLRGWLIGARWLTVGLILTIVGFLLASSWSFWWTFGLSPLWDPQWYPYENHFGLLAALAGTVWSVGIALALAVPSALAAAVMTAEILSSQWRGWVRVAMETLAGVPSIVHGLVGLWVILPWLQRTFGLLTGHGLLAAGLVLALMILPTVTVLSDDALREVSTEQRETALALGLDWPSLLLRVVLPQAWPGIRSAVLLATGRALGETVAVMLVVGSLDRLPSPPWNLLQPAQTLTSRIGREIGESVFASLHFSGLMACALLLALLGAGTAWMAGGRRW